MRTIFNKYLRQALVLLLLTGQSAFAQTSWMGMKFHVGSSPLVVNSLGRIYIPGNNGTHQVKLVDAATGKDLPNSQVDVSMSGGTANRFNYSPLAATVVLNPGSAYYLVSSETVGGDQWYDANSTLTTANAATCLGGVYWDGNTWIVKGNTNNAFVPLDFTYGGLMNAVNVPNVTNGLDYAYYENNWLNIIPDLNYHAPVKTGSVANFDLSVKNRANQIVIKYTGYINVPADGNYTFTTNSDDQSKLYIHDALIIHNKLIWKDVSGSIGLKAGRHPIKVEFLNALGGDLLNVSYAGPGINKQLIPASALYRGGDGPVSNPSTIFSGYYKVTARHSGKSLDVKDRSTANGGQVQQWNYSGADNQQWFLTHVGDGYYKFTAKHSNKALALDPNSFSSGNSTITSDGVNVIQEDNTNIDSHLWNIETLGGGYYRLINKASRKVLSVVRGSTDAGAYVHQFQDFGAHDQQWQLELVGNGTAPPTPPTSPNPVSNFSGYYKVTARHSGKVLDVSGYSTANNAQIHQWGYAGGPNQQWLFTYVSDGYYKLTAKHSNKALAIDMNPGSNGGFTDITSNGVNIVQQDNTNTDNHLWTVEAVGGGYYKLINKASRKALDVSGVSTNDGARVHQWQYLGATNQQWQLESVSPPVSPPAGPEANAIYELTPQCAGCTDKRLHAPGGTFPGAQINAANNQNSQRWKLISVGGGNFELQSQSATGSNLDVDNGQGPRVQIYPGNATNAQRWKLIPINEANGIYELEPLSTLGKRLDIENSAGPSVQVFQTDGTNSQRWKLTKVGSGARVGAESVESTQLSVYPNPAQNQVTLESGEELANVQVFNIIGVLSLSKHNLAASRVVMEVASLPKGMYIIKAVTKQGRTLVEKLIINH